MVVRGPCRVKGCVGREECCLVSCSLNAFVGDLRLEGLRDGEREVGEEQLLVLGASELRLGTTEEGLELHATDPSGSRVPEDQARDVDHALSIDEELDLAVRLANVVEPDALRDSGPAALGEAEGATADGSTVGGVAVRRRGDIADSLVGTKARGQVGVEFTSSTRPPHETDGEASIIATTTRAAGSLAIAVATIETGKLSTEDGIEASGHVDGVAEGCLFSSGEVDGGRPRGVERETTLGTVTESVRALGVGSPHGGLAIGSLGVGMGNRPHNLLGAESAIGEGQGVGIGGGDGPGHETTASREQIAESTTASGRGGGCRALGGGCALGGSRSSIIFINRRALGGGRSSSGLGGRGRRNLGSAGAGRLGVGWNGCGGRHGDGSGGGSWDNSHSAMGPTAGSTLAMRGGSDSRDERCEDVDEEFGGVHLEWWAGVKRRKSN
jgi:hypothetical protein